MAFPKIPHMTYKQHRTPQTPCAPAGKEHPLCVCSFLAGQRVPHRCPSSGRWSVCRAPEQLIPPGDGVPDPLPGEHHFTDMDKTTKIYRNC